MFNNQAQNHVSSYFEPGLSHKGCKSLGRSHGDLQKPVCRRDRAQIFCANHMCELPLKTCPQVQEGLAQRRLCRRGRIRRSQNLNWFNLLRKCESSSNLHRAWPQPWGPLQARAGLPLKTCPQVQGLAQGIRRSQNLNWFNLLPENVNSRAIYIEPGLSQRGRKSLRARHGDLQKPVCELP